MAETIERAERAADFADRRARDADRISRGMIGIALGLAGLLIAGQITINVQVNGLVDDVREIRARVDGLAVAVDELAVEVATMRGLLTQEVPPGQ